MPQYSIELRQRALEHNRKHKDIATTSNLYDISHKTLRRWIAKFEKGKKIESKPKSGRPASLGI